MRIRAHLLLLAAAFGTLATPASAWTILTVGPAGQYASIAEAVTAADADTNLSHLYEIHVAPGTYLNDFSDVTRPMRIMVDPAHAGQQVLLEATVPLPNEKGIIVADASLEVNGLTFKGAAIAASLGGNGAGIRDQNTQPGSFLMVENSTFLNNQEGILTGNNIAETVQILNSQFIGNGNPADPNGQEHALYVNDALSLLVNNSLFCDTMIGHDIKSRALSTTVENSQIYVGTADTAVPGCSAGSTSLGVDVPNGGQVNINADQIFQGDNNQNGAMVSYGEEGLNYAVNSFTVSDTSFDNLGTRNSTGIQELKNGTPTCLVPVQLSNATFQHVTTPVNPPGCVDPPTPVPEPQSLWLLLTALGCCAAFSARAAPAPSGAALF